MGWKKITKEPQTSSLLQILPLAAQSVAERFEDPDAVLTHLDGRLKQALPRQLPKPLVSCPVAGYFSRNADSQGPFNESNAEKGTAKIEAYSTNSSAQHLKKRYEDGQIIIILIFPLHLILTNTD
jgi:hypothetical protein